MGMFDSMYDSTGREWQTKALGRYLNRYELGDRIPGPKIDYQIMALRCGDRIHEGDGFATVRAGHLDKLTMTRDHALPLVGYNGAWIEDGE